VSVIRLYIDEDSMDQAFIQALRARGVDVRTAYEEGLSGRSDADQLRVRGSNAGGRGSQVGDGVIEVSQDTPVRDCDTLKDVLARRRQRDQGAAAVNGVLVAAQQGRLAFDRTVDQQ